ncbi:MAG TPA: Rieske 2Fe-2S domain-containing protein [Chloroflexota bacterium]|nr:Rieske 2Fe-2S domain-containing protein [Chloroflexota bacterium]
MLSKEDNDTICRVGPGTPMGDVMRQYWVPALAASELPAPDCAPVRVKLLGEELIAFRDVAGRVGLLGNHCPHRGASLFFGRNEQAGLRCVYHGWKFDVTGACVDMPNEPPESNFKSKVRATAYPCRERGGVIWAYMGPRSSPPSLPDIEPNMLPDGDYTVGVTMRSCNWLQGLEGDIDTSHLQILHQGSMKPEDVRPGTMAFYGLADRAPRYQVVDVPGGTMYGAYRPAGDSAYYWRIALFLFPFYSLIPTGLLGHQVQVRAWVPMDDEHMMFFSMAKRGAGSAPPRADGGGQLRATTPDGRTPRGGLRYHPNGTGWYDRFRLVQDLDNDYLIDRAQQRSNGSFTGIAGIPVQDAAATEGMGAIADRSQEHLVSSDAMIIRTRRRLLEAARALRERGQAPPGVDEPEVYSVRSGGVILPRDADWIAATADLRKAFIDHPGLDLSIVGDDS